MSDTMEEGVIASWQKKVGDKVEAGDILAEVETDKATMELEAYEDGVLLHIAADDQESVPVDGVIAIIGEEGENIDELLKQIEGKSDGAKKEHATSEIKEEEEKKTDEGEIDTSDIDAAIVTMPKMSDTMEEGVIASWQKKVGDKVESGDILAEVETDKATMELESYEDGTLLYTAVEAGDSVPVDDVIAIIGEEGEDFEKLLKVHKAKAKAPPEEGKPSEKEDKKKVEEKKPAPAVSSTAGAQVDTQDSNGRIKASPLAKRLAEEKGYDLAKIEGSGDYGRIIKRDIENYTPEKEAPEKAPSIEIPKIVGEESYEEIDVSQMRKTIAKRLSESKFTSPHFYLTMEIKMDKAIQARKSINEVSPIKISFNDIVLKAAAAALRRHPDVNSSWLGDKIRKNHHVHIGVAVAVDEGLLVPVVRFADNKPLSHIAAEVKELAAKAKNKQLQPSDWEGNTFTISNLGMFGIEEFTAIINPPDSCILAVGGIKETAVVKDGELVPGNLMKVTLSCDHRVVDGAKGAAFLQTLKGFLEDPVTILV